MDSRKFSGGHKSNFSQTCTLLSQFMKENGSLGDLSLGLSTNLQPHVTTPFSTGSPKAAKTKNFLPMIEKSGQNMDAPTRERSQMTIFYGGQVMVFDNFPADKVSEIMAMADNGGSQNSSSNTFLTTCVAPKPAESSSTNMVVASNVVPSFAPFVDAADMPRKASLARFFEKRKDRITARAPYQTSKSITVSSRPTESKTWLGLATQSSPQVELRL